MTTWFKHWFHKFVTPVDWELESYLAGAADCADLEHRMQAWSRRLRPRY